jgi:hypothetical protein
VAVANAPAASENAVRVIDPPPAQVPVVAPAPAAATSEEPFLPMPDLRGGEDAAPAPAAAPAQAPAVAAAPAAPAPPVPAAATPAADPASEAATLEERMFVESAPVDPNVANSYATAEEGGLTGLVLRLYQQEETPAE